MPSSIAMVVLDWAGTTVDHGSLAPVRTLQRVFAGRGIELADAVARRDMGIAKIDHIRKLLAEPEVHSEWQRLGNSPATEREVEALYKEFIPLQMACLLDYAKLIDGVLPVVEGLRASGIRIGGTTGYTRPMLEALEAAATPQGYTTDESLCPDDVGAGRPHPFMCYELAVRLRASPLWTCVKIGDTVSDVEEGRNAGMWTIAITRTGNMTGLSEEKWNALSPEAQAAKSEVAHTSLQKHAPHFIVPSVADILPVIAEIEQRILRGERP